MLKDFVLLNIIVDIHFDIYLKGKYSTHKSSDVIYFHLNSTQVRNHALTKMLIRAKVKGIN